MIQPKVKGDLGLTEDFAGKDCDSSSCWDFTWNQEVIQTLEHQDSNVVLKQPLHGL